MCRRIIPIATGGVSTPAVQPTAGVNADNITLFKDTLAGNPVHDLIVDRNATHVGKGYFFAGYALKERLRLILAVQPLDGRVQLGRGNTRLDELRGTLVSLVHHFSSSSHLGNFAI